MHSDNRRQQLWWTRLSVVVCVVLTLTWAHGAIAAVPMCGVHAQTVAAPPIGTPASPDVLNTDSPCDQTAPLRAAGVPNREAPQPLVLTELQVRALPILLRLPRARLTGRLSAAAAEHELCATGFARSIDRPPRG